MKTIELSTGVKVEVKESLNFGEANQVQSVIRKSAKLATSSDGSGQNVDINAEDLMQANFKLLEVAITKITEGEKEISYSRGWLDKQSTADAKLLFQGVQHLSQDFLG